MKLKKIEITGLWHEFNVAWNLEPDVNILVGGNGAGKTTLLDLICTVIPPLSMNRYLSNKANKIKLTFEDNYVIECVVFRDSFGSLKRRQSQTHLTKKCLKKYRMILGRKRSQN